MKKYKLELLLTKTYPDGGRIDYAYDAHNRLASTTWTREVSEGVRLKATRTYAEKTGELVSVSYNDEATPTETHTYNHLGQLTQTVDAAGTRVYVYNNYNEVESETLTALGAMQTPSYDAFGREIYTTLKRGDTTLALFGQSYDAASGRIASGAYGNAVFAFSYLSGTKLISEIGVMNGYVMTKKISYEANRDLPTEITYEKPDASLVAKRNYAYDALGRVSSRPQTRGNGTPREDTFGYNPRSELISATLGNVNYAYAFDNIGNRTSSTEAGTQSSYSANALNQYDSISLGEAVSSPLQYDADGNATLIQTPTGTWAITYNGANRPIRFENAETQTVVECAYDSQGRRFEKKVTVSGTMTLREHYLYKGYLQIAAFDVSESGETLNYTLKRIVYWNPTEPTATRPLAVNIVNDGVYFPTVDLTKNVCELVDAYGDIVATYDYAPFGAVTAGTPSGTAVPANPLQWSSEVYDSELDLVYYNYRHYSPTLGRFLSRDPIEEKGGLNLYTLVKNKVTFVCDSLGNSSVSIEEILLWQKNSYLTTCENDYQREITDFFSYRESVSAFSWTLSTKVTTITPFACAVSCYTSADNWEDNQPPQEGNALSCAISGMYSSSGFSLQLPSFGAATSDKFVAMASFDFSASYEINENTSLSLSVSGRAPLTNIGDTREWIQSAVDSLSLGIRVVITF